MSDYISKKLLRDYIDSRIEISPTKESMDEVVKLSRAINDMEIELPSYKAITELAVKTLNDVIDENYPAFPHGRSKFIRERLLEIERIGGEKI